VTALRESERRPRARAFDDAMGAMLVIRRYALAVLVAVLCNLTVSVYTLTQSFRISARVDKLESRIERLEDVRKAN
jgi:hypothetical protein